MYTVDLLAMVAASVACLFIHDAFQLILRVRRGPGRGRRLPHRHGPADGMAPQETPRSVIGWLSTIWLVGAITAYLVGFAMTSAFGQGSWRWMLASGAVFGIIVMLLRLGAHESPRWLVANGRIEEARTAVTEALGRNVTTEEILTLARTEETEAKASFGSLLKKPFLRRTLFCGLTWMCIALPQFALFTYGPASWPSSAWATGAPRRPSARSCSTSASSSVPSGAALGGDIGRRPLMIWTFVAAAAFLLPLGLFPQAPGWFLMVFFFLFTLASGAGTILVFIYPNELFPTSVRASAVGLATAISRIGAAIGTYMIPLSLSGLGAGPTLLIGFGLTVVGLLISIAWAEETRNKSLTSLSTKAMDIVKVPA